MGRATVAVHAAVRAPGYRCGASMRRARGHADLTDQLARGMRRAVTRGRARKQARTVRRIGVDEKAGRHGPSLSDTGL
jgi:hypothetical protein